MSTAFQTSVQTIPLEGDVDLLKQPKLVKTKAAKAIAIPLSGDETTTPPNGILEQGAVKSVVQQAAPTAGADGSAVSVSVSAPVSEQVTFATVFAKVAVGMAKFKEIVVDLKALQKDTARLAKESIRRPRRVADPTAEPSGFRKPVGLSADMARFVGVEHDAKVSRNNVTKAVTTYIKAHNLQDTPDKRVILPDSVLKALLGIDEQKLTYFNLQSFLKKHFLKADASTNQSAVQAPVTD